MAFSEMGPGPFAVLLFPEEVVSHSKSILHEDKRANPNSKMETIGHHCRRSPDTIIWKLFLKDEVVNADPQDGFGRRILLL
jgi:hypothetical protein